MKNLYFKNLKEYLSKDIMIEGFVDNMLQSLIPLILK